MEDFKSKIVVSSAGDSHPLAPSSAKRPQREGNIEVTRVAFDPLSAMSRTNRTLASLHPVPIAQTDPKSDLLDTDDLAIPKEDDAASDYWNKIKEQIIVKSDHDFAGDKAIQLMEESESIHREIKIGGGKSRIFQLDTAKGKTRVETMTLTKTEYRKQMKILFKEMHSFWKREDKVTCLKIVIQCSKLLNTIENATFYPEKFIGICDLYDTFSTLVFDRMKTLAFNPEGKKDFDLNSISEDTIKPELVNQHAKLIATNWFLKTSCIREVLPRCYVELALAKCYMFTSAHPIQHTLKRIAMTIRGVSNPLAGCYVATYLARVGFSIDPNLKNYLMIILEMILWHVDSAKNIGYPGMTSKEYMACFDPCLDWIIYCLCTNIPQVKFNELIELYKKYAKHAQVLPKIIEHSPEKLVSAISRELLQFMQTYSGNEQIILIDAIARSFTKSPPNSKKLRLDFMKYAWEKSRECTDPVLYMSASASITEFAIKFLKVEKIEFLHDIFDKFKSFVTKTEQDTIENVKLYQSLERVILQVIVSDTVATEMLSIDSLLPLFDYFSEKIKKKLCSMILVNFVKGDNRIKDLITVHTLFGIGKVLHDSVDFLASESEQREVGDILKLLVSKIDFGTDLEGQLKVYTQARGIFINFDSVTQALIKCGLHCGIKAFQYVKLRHTRKTLGFVKSCLSFVNISIPSLQDPLIQVQFYFETAEVALLNGMISEVDTLCKAVIKGCKALLLEKVIPIAIIEKILLKLIGFLLVAPANPEIGGFELIIDVFNLIRDYKWEPEQLFTKMRLLIHLIRLVNGQLQDKFPYHIYRVDSNDSIFLNDTSFLVSGSSLFNELWEETLLTTGSLDEKYESSSHLAGLVTMHDLCLSTANTLLGTVIMNKSSMKIIQKFITIGDKYKQAFLKNAGGIDVSALPIKLNEPYMQNTLSYYERKIAAQGTPAH